MKNVITHPLTVMISFMIVIISGQHVGGFYVIYLFLGLKIAAVHSITGLMGILLLVPPLLISNRKQTPSIYILNILGALLMLCSLSVFFLNDKQQYNSGTFSQPVPLATLILFGLILLAFFSVNSKRLFGPLLVK